DLRRRTVRGTPERRQMKTDLHKNSGRLLASGPPSLDGCALSGLHSQPLMPDQFGTPLAWPRYCRPVPPRKSISLECLGNLLRIARPGKHQTQEDASLLWTQIVPGDDRHVAKIAARRD